MAFPVGARSTGELITAAIWNADLKDNLTNLYAGTLSMTGQANGHFVMASTSTQLVVKKNSNVKVFAETFGG